MLFRSRVALRWSVSHANGDRSLEVVWRETDGPSVRPPVTSGAGSSLLEGVIADATVTREFLEQGVVCTIVVPLSRQDGDENGDGQVS